MTIKIRSVSDLHLEFFSDAFEHSSYHAVIDRIVPPLKDDLQTVLVLAGDVTSARKMGLLPKLFASLIPRFKHIIYVLGNHEHYHGYLHSTSVLIEDVLHNALGEDISKITIAGNVPVKVEIDDVSFLCGTLWTDYGGKDAHHIHKIVEQYITDHRAVKGNSGAPVKALELIDIHKRTIKQFGQWMKDKPDGKFVVCTHHMPSFSAIHPQYLSNDPITKTINHAFATDLDSFILKYNPVVWVFGHTHTKYFGKVGNTVLICNPFGYPQEKNSHTGVFDKYNIFEV